MDNSSDQDADDLLRRRRPRLNVKPATAEGLRRVLLDADQKAKQQAVRTLGAEWAVVWREWLDILSPSTRRLYRHDTTRFASWCAARRGAGGGVAAEAETVGTAIAEALVFEAGQVEGFAEEWKQSMVTDGVTDTVINRRLAALRSLISFAGTSGLVAWSVKVGNRPIRPTSTPGGEVLTDADIDHVRSHLHRATWNATMTQKRRWRRDGALFELLATTGIRPEEVRRLAVSALDAKGRLFIPSRHGAAEYREIRLPKRALRAIGTWVDLRARIDPTISDRNEPLFVGISRHGRFTTNALTSDGMRRILHGIAADSGLDPPRLRPRDLQRYAVAQLADQEPTTIATTSTGQPIELPAKAAT